MYICAMSEQKIKIQKGVPLTLPHLSGKGGRPRTYPWDKLEVGDSFYMDHQHSPYSMLKAYNYSLPLNKRIKITRRKEGSGQRIWRIK